MYLSFLDIKYCWYKSRKFESWNYYKVQINCYCM